MLYFLLWFSKQGEYERILAWPHVKPRLADTAERAIAKGAYEDRGTRDDGAMILVTKTEPPLVVVAKVRSEAGGRPDLLMLNVAEVRGEGHRFSNA